MRQLYYNKTMESRAKRANLSEGRINQKLRTRRALLEAASRLVRQGLNPTLAEIAEMDPAEREFVLSEFGFGGADDRLGQEVRW